jgi:hypothetical protein
MLVISSPHYLFWPPTHEEYNKLIVCWMSKFSETSCLSRIIFDTGSGDEGQAVDDYYEENSDLNVDQHFNTDNGFVLYWKLQGKEWVTCNMFPEFEEGEEHYWEGDGWTWTLEGWFN